jgi:hypothetical protein
VGALAHGLASATRPWMLNVSEWGKNWGAFEDLNISELKTTFFKISQNCQHMSTFDSKQAAGLANQPPPQVAGFDSQNQTKLAKKSDKNWEQNEQFIS